MVLCVGYDLANRNFLLSDTNFKELQKVSFDDLTKARSSKAEPYPLTYNWFSIDKFEPFKNLAKQIEVSIKLNSDNFLSGQNSLRGTSSVYGILDWLGNVQYWNSYSDSSDIFRLPTGYKSDTFEIEVSGDARIREIQIGETPYGLRSV